MARESEILMTLAETLDVEKTLETHGIHGEDLAGVLAKAAALARKMEKPPADAEFVLMTDGASRGNPGPSGAGFVIYRADRLLEGQAQYLGEVTNNQAEYNALILGLTRLAELGARKVVAKADSELMVKQMNGEYKVKNKNITPLFIRAKQLSREFESFRIEHVMREENSRADEMANRAIDEFQDD